MTLPCPHCKSRFKLDIELLPFRTVKLKCPSCNGMFALQPPSAIPKRPKTSPDKNTNAPLTDPLPDNKEPLIAAEEKVPEKELPERKVLTGWAVLIPAGILLFALIGVLGILKPVFLPVSPKNIQTSSSGQSSASPTAPGLRSSPSENIQIDTLDTSTPFYQTLWPFSPLAVEASCHRLMLFQEEYAQNGHADRCRIYPPWIAYLTFETSPVTTCALESAFNLASDALQKKTDCGLIYAFLSAYYAHKKITDRSQIFLNEALQLSKKDPWIKMVEAYYYQKIRQTPKEAISILKKLTEKEPEFPLAPYHLARLYIGIEEYEKAKDLFKGLQDKFPDQGLFSDINQTLATILNVPYYSSLMAGGLLDLSSAFIALRDYDIAGQLARKALHEMPNMLSEDQQKKAYYQLGRIYEITGKNNKAYSAYLRTLKIDPAFKPARQSIQKLLPPKEQM